MKIAPIDIAHKSFAKKMLGYDLEEVNDFLKSVSNEMETLIRERNNLKENLREKNLQINEFRERDELLKQTITTATRMSEKLQTDAEREAKLILNDAHQKADVIVADARDSLKRMYQEISDLKRVRMQFENNLRALFQSHITMLEQGREVMPNPETAEVQISENVSFTAPTMPDFMGSEPGANSAARKDSANQVSTEPVDEELIKKNIERMISESKTQPNI